MKKNINFFIFFFVIGSLFYSCDKEEDGLCCADIVSDNGIQARLSYTDKGYIEIEVIPIIKNSCYFSDYDTEIFIPVSGLYEYYDTCWIWKNFKFIKLIFINGCNSNRKGIKEKLFQ